MTDRPMTVDEVARFCGVSAKTVRRAPVVVVAAVDTAVAVEDAASTTTRPCQDVLRNAVFEGARAERFTRLNV